MQITALKVVMAAIKRTGTFKANRAHSYSFETAIFEQLVMAMLHPAEDKVIVHLRVYVCVCVPVCMCFFVCVCVCTYVCVCVYMRVPS